MSQIINYDKILEAIIALSSETNFFKLLDIVLTKMREITNCEAGTLYIRRDDKLYFTIVHNEKLGIFTYEEDTDIPPVDLKLNEIENVCAYCAINNKMVNIDDVYKNKDFNFQGPRKYDAMTGFRTQSMLVFPLADLNGRIIGVIQLLNSRNASGDAAPFDKGWENTIWSLSSIAAIALTNVRYMVEIKELFNSFVKVMTAAIDERTPYNANHTVNVAKYTEGFIRFLRGRFEPGSPYHMDENREEQLVMAAYLHDIGKIVTPLEIMDKQSRLGGRLPAIMQRFEIKKLHNKIIFLSGQTTKDEYNKQTEYLNDTRAFVERINTAGFLLDDDFARIETLKQITYTDDNGDIIPVFDDSDIESLSTRKGTLTDTEREIMQEHVSVTERLLGNIKFNEQYENVPNWAKSHHEFIDGTGYPYKATDSQIPVEVRILTVMDIYDALTASDRPYKKGMPHEAAVKVLLSMADEGKLDMKIIRLFVESGIGSGRLQAEEAARMYEKIKVMLVEDDADFAFLIRKMIDKDSRLDFLAHASSRISGTEAAKRLKPDIVVMDLNLSGNEIDGIETAKEIRLTTGAKVVLLTSYENPEMVIDASKRAFASGYVFKGQCRILTDIINDTAVSNTPQETFIKELLLSELTSAERGILNDLVEGKMSTLSSSSKTVANQKTSIFKKLGLKNTEELIRLFKNW